MDAILFDMDGVLYEGGQPIKGARETIAWCRAERIPHLFLTNTTSRPRSALVDKLAAMGIDADSEQILTPPVAARSWLSRNVTDPVALFVPPHTRDEFSGINEAGSNTEKVSAVVLGDLGEQWSFADYNRAFRLLMENPAATLIALGMTRYWRAEDGLRLDVGPFVKGLEYAVGIEATVMGKPAPAFFRSALEKLDMAAERTVMVGDDIRGDIDGAQHFGLHGVLVRTGKFRADDLSLGITPTSVIDSIADLPRLWEQLSP